MILTDRDYRLIRDIALSHLLSRDQMIALGYFSSHTRVNTRLRMLVAEGLIKRLDTPFFTQSLYSVTPLAAEVLGERVGAIVSGRTGSPRFIQHALCITNSRLELVKRGAKQWRFEQQLRRSFTYSGKKYEIRPDGLAVMAEDKFLLVEIDLGHVAPQKFGEKLGAYDAFIVCGLCESIWKVKTFRVLTLTTGERRARKLDSLTPSDAKFVHFTKTFEEFNVPAVGAWS